MLFKAIMAGLTFFSMVFFPGITLGADKISWKLGGVHSVGSPETIGLKKFAELTEKKTGGRLKIQIFPAGQLGAEVPQMENLMSGVQEMFANAGEWVTTLSKEWTGVSMPFLFANLDHAIKFQKSQEYERLKMILLNSKGVRILGDNWYRLPRALLAKKSIRSPKDLEGVKLRMSTVKANVETYKAMGAKVIITPWAEAFLALKTGVVDAVDSPLGSIYAQKFYQAAPYISLINHQQLPFFLLVNNKKYQALPGDQQKGLAEAAREAGDFYTHLVQDEYRADKEKMIKEGATFIEVNQEDFAAVAYKVAERLEEEGLWSKGLFAKVRKMR